MVNIRLMGLPDDVELVSAVIRATLDTVEMSAIYPNKRGDSRLVRQYIQVLPRLVFDVPYAVQGADHDANK
jgi:hypothetical protein